MKPTNIPSFPFPFEYCTIERAAQLLNCLTTDIKHLHEIRAINLCVKFNEESNIKNAILRYLDIESNDIINHPFGRSSNIISLNTTYSHLYSELSDDELDDASDNDEGDLEVSLTKGQFTLNGLFHIEDSDSDIIGYVPIEHPSEPAKNNSFMSTMLFDKYADPKTKAPPYDYYILRSDLQKVFLSLHTGDCLPNMYNTPELRNGPRFVDYTPSDVHQNKKTRVEAIHKDILIAFYHCNPELVEKIDKRKNIESIPLIINKYLQTKELNTLRPFTGKTFQTLIKSETYNPKLS